MINRCSPDIGTFLYDFGERGPGKWVITDIDNYWFNDILAVGSALSRTEEGKFWLNGGKDSLLGRKRMVTLEWIPPDDNPYSIYDSEENMYGETQIVEQTYSYYRANWVVGGYTYGWYPPVTAEHKKW